MGLLNAAILSTYTVLPNPLSQSFANPSEEALKHLSKAMYVELKLDKVARKLEKERIPKWARDNGPWIVFVGSTIIDRKISYRWVF